MVNIDDLRDRLMDYYGTAAFSGFPVAIMDVERIRKMSDEEILEEAESLGWIE